jgi:hypothetical protein
MDLPAGLAIVPLTAPMDIETAGDRIRRAVALAHDGTQMLYLGAGWFAPRSGSSAPPARVVSTGIHDRAVWALGPPPRQWRGRRYHER